MVNRTTLIGIFYFATMLYSCDDKKTTDVIYAKDCLEKKEYLIDAISQYLKKFKNVQVLYLINDQRIDTSIFFLGAYFSELDVQGNNPFGYFIFKGRKVYLFSVLGSEIKNDPEFHRKQVEIAVNDYPIWKITFTMESVQLDKNADRTYLLLRGMDEYSPPAIVDTSEKDTP